MMLRTKLLLLVNQLFRAPVHPFNLQCKGIKSYAMWQYEKGADALQFYLQHYTLEELFAGKAVADIGCGAAGKSLYYAANGATKVYGIEILNKYRTEANNLALKLGLSDRFEFVCADAAHLPFIDNSIDTIIMNDAMEHVSHPRAVLRECLRVLKTGGRLYINFPPYYHPFGAHLSDLIYIPWVHLFFPEKVLVEAYRELAKLHPDGQERINFRISTRKDGSGYFSYINHMTISRFARILCSEHLTPVYYHHEPLRGMFRILYRLPFLQEILVKMVVCVIEKEAHSTYCIDGSPRHDIHGNIH